MAAVLPGSHESALRHRQKNYSYLASFSTNSFLSVDVDMKKYAFPPLKESFCLVILSFYSVLFALTLQADRWLPAPKSISESTGAGSSPLDGEGVLPHPRHLGEGFVEERARNHLVTLTSIGPRIAGSYENEVLAVDVLLRELNFLQRGSRVSHWNFEVDVQKPIGSFNLQFQDGFTSYYHKVKNVLVKLEPKGGTNHSLLVNCHFDTAPGSPGASDDAVSCAIMLEVLNILSRSTAKFQHTIIFSFNGAEENILQAAHGFITQHEWAKKVRAFINLESCGSGGREIVFQAGPENPWLIQAYADHVPYPFASVMGQEIFKSGVIPGDTDYRIYRDYGHIPGLDIAYIKNGYIYHTKYDTEKYIPRGSIQRAGENFLALVRHFATSPKLADPGTERTGNIVFFDVLGMFVVTYSETFGLILNWATIVLALCKLWESISSSRFSGMTTTTYVTNLGLAVMIILLGWASAIIVVIILANVVTALGSAMSWFTNTYWIVGLYGAPAITAQILVHTIGAELQKKVLFRQAVNNPWLEEEVYFEAIRLIWVALLATLSLFGIRSSFLVMIWIICPVLMRSFGSQIFIKSAAPTNRKFLLLHMISQVLPGLEMMYATLIVHYIFVPIVGRTGSNIKPDILIAILACACSIFLSSLMISLIHAMRSVKRLLLVLIGISALSLFLVTCTSLGFPYSSNDLSPTPQRYLIMHVDRSFLDQSGNPRKADSGFWVLPMDYNGPDTIFDHIPELKSAHPVQSDCQEELYCGMPYYFPVSTNLGKTFYVPAPKPKIHIPLRMQLVSQNVLAVDSTRRITFTVTGPSHMGVIVSPAIDVTLSNWSFADGVPGSGPLWRQRPTYFIYYSNGELSSREPWVFSIDLKIPSSHSPSESIFTVVSSSHFLHGPEKTNDELEEFLARFPDWSCVVGWVGTYQSQDYYM